MSNDIEYRTSGVFKDGVRYLLPEEDWDKLYPSENNVRKSDIEGTIEWEELKGSIKQNGIEQELVIIPDGGITDGQRRFKVIREIVAEEDLEYEEYEDGRVREGRVIPLLCKDLSPEEEIRVSIARNAHRKDLSAHDLALGISGLVEKIGSQHDVAVFLGQSDSWVSERLTILSTPERRFDKDTGTVKEVPTESVSLKDVPQSKAGSMGSLLTSSGKGNKTLKRKIVSEAVDLPRDALKDVKKDVEKEKDITPEEVLQKVEEKKEEIKRTKNRTFRLSQDVNDGLNVAKGQGLIEDHHTFVNEVLKEALYDLGVLE